MADSQPNLAHAAPQPHPNHYQFKDLTGKKFGRLEVLFYCGKQGGRSRWLCRCECGNKKVTGANVLIDGRAKSCGCLHIEHATNLHKLRKDSLGSLTHGMSKTRLHRTWRSMKDRCHNPKSAAYEKYGAKGVCVCEEWRSSFESFKDWSMSNGYSDALTIDRINSRGNYDPSNCRWVSWAVNSALAHWSHGKYASTVIPDDLETSIDKRLKPGRGGKRYPENCPTS